MPDWPEIWGIEQLDAWRRLKKEMSDPTIPAGNNPALMKVVINDASYYRLGGVILNEYGYQTSRTIYFT